MSKVPGKYAQLRIYSVVRILKRLGRRQMVWGSSGRRVVLLCDLPAMKTFGVVEMNRRHTDRRGASFPKSHRVGLIGNFSISER